MSLAAPRLAPAPAPRTGVACDPVQTLVIRTSDGTTYIVRDTHDVHDDPGHHLEEVGHAPAGSWVVYQLVDGAPVYLRASSIVSVLPEGAS